MRRTHLDRPVFCVRDGARALVWVFAGVVATTMAMPSAHARKQKKTNLSKLGETLARLDKETDVLRQGIKRPSRTDKAALDRAERRLIDGQVAFGVGNYDDASVMLYDYVEQYPNSPSYDEALYYLSESLFQKRDFVAARSYFTKLVKDVPPTSKFYQQGLERLVELSLELSDGKGVDEWLRALDSIPESKKRPSVPYVRGKYAFFKNRFDEALQQFGRVPANTEYTFQARYFIGTSHVSKGDLGAAAKAFQQLIRTEAKTSKDKRVVELAHMALGRIFYEREQPSKAIDEYTKVDRESDLFDEALFEVAWVYVKDDQYDKALRALELLALADPTSSKMPDVRILEGNLRIRKAQSLAKKDTGNSAEEYAKAQTLFETTHTAFKQPHAELSRIIQEQSDTREFLSQITGRLSDTFEVNATMPEVAASWIRDEPDVMRVVDIESDLGEIDAEIKDAEATIDRLERALSSPSRVNIFPSLAVKRTRATEILEAMFDIRLQLVSQERKLVDKYADADEKQELQKRYVQRQAIVKMLDTLPNADVAYGERIERARNDYTTLDQRAAEVATLIDASRATLVALERFVLQEQEAGRGSANAEQANKAIAELRTEIDAMGKELTEVRRAALLAKDEAGTGDVAALRARELRAQLRTALASEHQYMAGVLARAKGGDRTKTTQIATMMRTTDSVTSRLDGIQAAVDEIVEFALAEVRSSLVEEKARLTAYKREFVQYEAESRVLGGVILGASFRVVKEKFYDVLIRSDIGVIDVSWSQKEGIDELAARLGLDRIREMRTLREEFRDIIEDKGDGL